MGSVENRFHGCILAGSPACAGTPGPSTYAGSEPSITAGVRQPTEPEDDVAMVLGVIAATLLVLLVLGGLTGRVRLTSCCSIADPRNDLRMRSAYDAETGPDGARRPGSPG